MRALISFGRVVFGLVLLVSFGIGSYFLLLFLIKGLIQLPDGIRTVIVTGVFTVFGSILTLFWTKSIERKREIEQENRKQKVLVYEKFMDFWFRIFVNYIIVNKEVPAEEYKEFMGTHTQKLLLWASDDVLREYSAFRKSALDGNDTLMFQFGKMLMAIRADIGHKNTDVNERDILRTFITDIDEY